MNWVWILGATKLLGLVVAADLLTFLYAPTTEKRKLFVTAFFALPIAFVVARLSSLIIYNPRPFVDGHMSALIPHITDNGFPSDHTLLAVTVAAIVYTHHKSVGSVLIALSLMVGVGRVLTGVHHVIDVLGRA